MPTTPYASYRSILIDDSKPFHDKTVALLNIIDGIPIGKRMLTAIQGSGKNVVIAPTVGSGGNKCTSGGAALFVRLRQAFRGGDIQVAEELSYTLDAAEKAGFTRMAIAKLIVTGLTPATVRTSGNLVHPPVAHSPQQAKDKAFRLSVILGDVTSGKIRYSNALWDVPGTYSLDDCLIRLLRPWLRPGTGSGSRINFSPGITESCVGEKSMQWRPPGIGLAHELVHAWRNAAGLRLFDDAVGCKVDDDEVMTTGIIPYMEEEFTENKFRIVWPLTTWEKWYNWVSEVPIRESYR